MVVYAIEFTVVVYKVADIGGVIALGVLVAFLFGEVPFFGEFAQRRSGYGRINEREIMFRPAAAARNNRMEGCGCLFRCRF